MNYYKIYQNLMSTRKFKEHGHQGYCETHHIIPKCMGGMNNDSNKVRLTAREHFIAHRLLVKIYDSEKLKYALWAMCNQCSKHQKREIINSHVYEHVKTLFSKSISGNNHWAKKPEFRERMRQIALNRSPMSQKTKDKISTIHKGKVKSTEWKRKIGKGNSGKVRTDENKKQISNTLKLLYKNGHKNPMQGVIREKTPCIYCGKLVDVANMKRWHNDNCKFKP